MVYGLVLHLKLYNEMMYTIHTYMIDIRQSRVTATVMARIVSYCIVTDTWSTKLAISWLQRPIRGALSTGHVPVETR